MFSWKRTTGSTQFRCYWNVRVGKIHRHCYCPSESNLDDQHPPAGVTGRRFRRGVLPLRESWGHPRRSILDVCCANVSSSSSLLNALFFHESETGEIMTITPDPYRTHGLPVSSTIAVTLGPWATLFSTILSDFSSAPCLSWWLDQARLMSYQYDWMLWASTAYHYDITLASSSLVVRQTSPLSSHDFDRLNAFRVTSRLAMEIIVSLQESVLRSWSRLLSAEMIWYDSC